MNRKQKKKLTCILEGLKLTKGVMILFLLQSLIFAQRNWLRILMGILERKGKILMVILGNAKIWKKVD